ncbi:MAG: peptide chain release factor N(5)-glutamine methyltransferase [Tannerellaceae bacterium]|jgi:release factor glutamine methyltransferase|nr:peptide chain release factor N(5)-glutamine methyltransferase [Tannerellaceae bacterium]
MTESILAYIKDSLSDIYPPGEVHSLTRRIIFHVCGLEAYHFQADRNLRPTEAQADEIRSIIERLRSWEPIQYIIGKTPFYGLSILVNPATLIPRPETEEMTHRIISETVAESPKILDIGTGSGCIGLALARYIPNSNVAAVDISPKALATAKENAERNHITINFIEADILGDTKHLADLLGGPYNIIVSNPPYIEQSEKDEMEPNVMLYEPWKALFVPISDPFVFYRSITQLAQQILSPGGVLWFEINARLYKETSLAISQEGFTNIELIRDLSGNNRFIKAQR